jgi:hypothetical protein
MFGARTGKTQSAVRYNPGAIERPFLSSGRQNRCETSRFAAVAEKVGRAYLFYARRIGFVIRCPLASILRRFVPR